MPIYATATASADEHAASGEPAPAELALSEPAPVTARPKPENEWPNGTRVMVRKRKSWREATIVSGLEPNYWRAEYPGGGSGMFEQSNIRAYDAERDAKLGKQLRRAKAMAPREASRSRYAVDPEAIAAGRLPEKAPVVTSTANPHYQKHFDRLSGTKGLGHGAQPLTGDDRPLTVDLPATSVFPPDPADLRAEHGRRLWGMRTRSRGQG
jgi:hypothetical protein